LPRKKTTVVEGNSEPATKEKKYHYVNTPFTEADYSLYQDIAEAFHKANVISEPKVVHLIKWSMQKLAEDLMNRRMAQLKEELKKKAQAEYEDMLRNKYPVLFDKNPGQIREMLNQNYR
jgi:hypothetical protein